MTSAVLPWDATINNIAIRIPFAFIFDFRDLFVPTLYFVATISLVFAVASIVLSLKDALPERLEVLLGGYILPPVGGVLFLPLNNVSTSQFDFLADEKPSGDVICVYLRTRFGQYTWHSFPRCC